MTRTLLAAAVAAAAAGPAPAGLYAPDDPCPFRVRPDGAADELGLAAEGPYLSGEFPLRLGRWANVRDDNPARANNPDRAAVLARIAEARKRELAPAAAAGLAADLLRVGRADEALNLLAPRARDRTPDFRVLANLAHVYAARGEWDDAVAMHANALDLADFPADLAGATPAQAGWLRKLERGPYRDWLRAHRAAAAARTPPAAEDVFPLFGARFVGDSGAYEPGKLAAAERAKLPPDAVAVVQQLLLWSPADTPLFWLLAEVLAADGRVREAAVLFDQGAEVRQYSNRAVFMAHRAAVRAAVAALPAAETGPVPPPPERPPADVLPSRGRVVGVAAGFAAVVLGLLVVRRRVRA